jgi:uncharacterized Zn-finger protein
LKNKVEVTKKEFVTKSITCDICGKTYDLDTIAGQLEEQEFLFLDFIGGYNSVFGDMNHIECDICQYCLKKFINNKYRETLSLEI